MAGSPTTDLAPAAANKKAGGLGTFFLSFLSKEPGERDRRLVLVVIGTLIVAGSLSYLLFCVRAEAPVGRLLGAGGVLASAAFASGSLLGLLFAIPPPRTPSARSEVLATNSSLQQVSEWLTKIILGASLTQVANLPPALARFGERYGKDFGGSGIAVFLLIHFVVTGFISGYLFTRVFLQHALYRADTPPPVGESVAPANDPQYLPNPKPDSPSPPAPPAVIEPKQS